VSWDAFGSAAPAGALLAVAIYFFLRWAWRAGSSENVERKRFLAAVREAEQAVEREAARKQRKCPHTNIDHLLYTGGAICRDCGMIK